MARAGGCRWIRGRRLIAVLAVFIGALGGCASRPALPSASVAEVADVLAAPDAEDFLYAVTTYRWEDGGADAGSRFDWIGRDASSPDPVAAARVTVCVGVGGIFIVAPC